MVGLLGVLVFYIGLKAVLPSGVSLTALSFGFIRDSLLGLCISGGAPLAFPRLHLTSDAMQSHSSVISHARGQTLRHLALILCGLISLSAPGCSRLVRPASILPTASAAPSAPRSSARFLGARIESGKGYRLDENGLMVVHLRGTEAEMRAQNHALLAAEIEAFQTAARRHRDLRSYIGGCSNIAAFGSASTDGTLWHGRNFDFGGHGVLDEFRVVYIVEPEGKIPYVTVSWSGPRPWNYEGVHTAMNASGLSLGYMISQAEGESINDAPSPWELYRKIMEDTETIDQAVDVLRASPRRGAANLLLADGKVPEAVVVEMSSKAIAVRRAVNDTVYATNHFVSPELFNPENNDSDSEARFQRLNELAGSRAFDLALTVSALRDRVDIHTRSTSPDGDIIGNPLNMLSVIFHPGDLTFWVASGAAPSSYRSFVGFNLTNELDGTPGQTDLPNIGEDETLDAASRAEIDAYQSGRRAYGRGVTISTPPGEYGRKVETQRN